MHADEQVERFIQDGFVRLEGAVPRDLVDECRTILWRDTGCDPGDPATWTQPVIRLGHYTQEPFVRAANTPELHAAFDRLVGKGRWLPPGNLGTFPVRFPSTEEPGDDGWHVEASFAGEAADPGDYFTWRTNILSQGRALLMLFLFSDVGPDDAPTRIRVGSHLDVARLLEPAGEPGMAFMELAQAAVPATEHLPVAHATGRAGDVLLCHPFVVHAAQPHHGSEPRFMAQPPLLSPEPFDLNRPDDEQSPVEQAIRIALGR